MSGGHIPFVLGDCRISAGEQAENCAYSITKAFPYGAAQRINYRQRAQKLCPRTFILRGTGKNRRSYGINA
jgi:hypothetical protein